MAGYIGKSQGVTQVDGYTRAELDGGQLDTRYYTESEVDSLLSGIASDAITEGNSSVEVVDTGTGYARVVVDGTETARFLSGGNFNFNSGYGSVATAYGCRAWVNFNGTGTVAIRGSGNVSSITDNGTGDYTVNFTTAMSDANYATVGTAGVGANTGKIIIYDSAAVPTTSAVRIANDILANLTLQDNDWVNVAVFR